MTGPESVPICQSLSWWKIMQTAESLAIKGVQRVFLRSCTELSTAHGDSCRGVEEFSHRVLMESRGQTAAMAGAPALHDVWFCVTEGTGKITLGERGREENNVLAGDWAAQCCGEPVYGRKHPGFAEPGAGFTGPAFDGAVRPRLSALYGSRVALRG